jgi:hypothetical protein
MGSRVSCFDPSQIRAGQHRVDTDMTSRFVQKNETELAQSNQSILTLETPEIEEIARAIWQRQHDTLNSSSIHYNADWRDKTLPSEFWNEFVLDAQAVLTLLYKKHIEHQKTELNSLSNWPS